MSEWIASLLPPPSRNSFMLIWICFKLKNLKWIFSIFLLSSRVVRPDTLNVSNKFFQMQFFVWRLKHLSRRCSLGFKWIFTTLYGAFMLRWLCSFFFVNCRMCVIKVGSPYGKARKIDINFINTLPSLLRASRITFFFSVGSSRLFTTTELVHLR